MRKSSKYVSAPMRDRPAGAEQKWINCKPALTVRPLFVEKQTIAKSTPTREVDPDIELTALGEAMFDGLPDTPVFTVDEVAKLLRIGRSAAYDLVRQRRLPSLRLGSQIRIPRRALVAFLRGMDADAFDSSSRGRLSCTLSVDIFVRMW